MKPRHQVNELFRKMWITSELLDMLVKMEALKLYQSLKVTFLNLMESQEDNGGKSISPN